MSPNKDTQIGKSDVHEQLELSESHTKGGDACGVMLTYIQSNKCL